jgi:hypothetical protein
VAGGEHAVASSRTSSCAGSGRIIASDIEVLKHVRSSGMKWMNGSTKRQCDRARAPVSWLWVRGGAEREREPHLAIAVDGFGSVAVLSVVRVQRAALDAQLVLPQEVALRRTVQM